MVTVKEKIEKVHIYPEKGMATQPIEVGGSTTFIIEQGQKVDVSVANREYYTIDHLNGQAQIVNDSEKIIDVVSSNHQISTVGCMSVQWKK